MSGNCDKSWLTLDLSTVALMVQELETNEITQVDRTTTAGGIEIADFKREVA